MNKKYIVAVIITIIIGFAFYNYHQLKEKEEYIATIEAKLNNIEEKNNTISQENKKLKEKLSTTQKEYRDINIYDVLIKEENKIEQEYPWLETQEWDKIVITSLDTDDEYIFVNDKRILKSISDFLHLEYETEVPPSGFKPDIPRYTYTFIKGDEQYDIKVEERGIVEIEGKYYVANLNVHKLGEALMPSPKWNKPDNIYSKIASGGILIANQGVSYSPFRMTMFADLLTDATLLDNEPSDKGEKKGESTLFSHGEEIKLESYDSYLHIVYGKQEYWYSFEEASFYLYHVFWGMG